MLLGFIIGVVVTTVIEVAAYFGILAVLKKRGIEWDGFC
jgi:hypothetical protein